MLIYRYGGGSKLKVQATTNWTAGQAVILGKIVGVCPLDILKDELVGIQIDGVFEGNAVEAETWSIGTTLYVKSDNTLTKTAGSDAFFGYAASEKITGATTAKAILIQRSPA